MKYRRTNADQHHRCRYIHGLERTEKEMRIGSTDVQIFIVIYREDGGSMGMLKNARTGQQTEGRHTEECQARSANV